MLLIGETFMWMIFAYFVLFFGVWLFSKFRKNRGKSGKGKGYFLMAWWAVGPSLFASNIFGEYFVGPAGSGGATGIGVVLRKWQVFAMTEYLKKRFQSCWDRTYLTPVALISIPKQLWKCLIKAFPNRTRHILDKKDGQDYLWLGLWTRLPTMGLWYWCTDQAMKRQKLKVVLLVGIILMWLIPKSQSAFCSKAAENFTSFVGQDFYFRWNSTDGGMIYSIIWNVCLDGNSCQDPDPLVSMKALTGKESKNKKLVPFYTGRVKFVGNMTAGLGWFRLKNVTLGDSKMFSARIIGDISGKIVHCKCISLKVKSKVITATFVLSNADPQDPHQRVTQRNVITATFVSSNADPQDPHQRVTQRNEPNTKGLGTTTSTEPNTKGLGTTTNAVPIPSKSLSGAGNIAVIIAGIVVYTYIISFLSSF